MATTLDQAGAAPEPVPTTDARPGTAGPPPTVPPRPPAVRGRRLAAGAVDALVLAVGLLVVIGTTFAIAADEELEWALWVWVFGFAPLYFALYHAWEWGGTPGQLELRVGVRSAGTGTPPGPARALARSYLGLAFAVLVVPAALDLVVLVATGRSLRDRITRTTVEPIALTRKAPELAQATVAELREIFEPPPGTRRYLRRGWALLRARPRMLLGSVAAVYGVLLAIVAVLGFLFVADAPDDPWSTVSFIVVSAALLVSGAYWTQAAMVLGVEEARVGSRISIGQTLVRMTRRANALSAALVLLLILAGAASVLLFPLLIAGRVALVAPALVLEDRRVLGAFNRSWQLTRGQTWRSLGLLLLSLALLTAAPVAVDAVPKPLAEGAAEDTGVLGWVAAGLLALPPLVAFALALAWVGAAWSLLYEDARRRVPPTEGP